LERRFYAILLLLSLTVIVALLPPAVSSLGVQSISLSFPSVPQFYSPDIIYENGIFKMWTTVGDSIRYFTSSDGTTWAGGAIVLSAQAGTWEDDGGSFEGYTTGLSDPRVIENVSPGWQYTMYYTGGPDPNTATTGGMGVAFSNDGVNWTRYSGNPVRTFPDGHTFAVQALMIGSQEYVYFFGGGSSTVPPSLRYTTVSSGVNFSSDTVTPLGGQVYPIYYDSSSGTCLLGESISSPTVSSGPTDTQLYQGSNCFSTMGQEIADIGSADTGHTSNFDLAANVRSPTGELTPGTGVQFYFASGDQWGDWQPASVQVSQLSSTESTTASSTLATLSNSETATSTQLSTVTSSRTSRTLSTVTVQSSATSSVTIQSTTTTGSSSTSLTLVTSTTAMPVTSTSTSGASTTTPSSTVTLARTSAATSAGLSVTPSPGSASVGSTVSVAGSGFSASDTSCSLSGGAVGTSTCSVSGGVLEASFVVANVEAGSYTIIVTGSPEGDLATFNFQVLTSGPSITLTPASAPVGSTVTVSGSGFSTSDTACSLFGGPTGTVSCSISGGALTGSFVVADVRAGSYTITATGSPAGDSASGTFTPVVASITLTPSTAQPGATVTVSGSGFDPVDTTCSLVGGGVGTQSCSISDGSLTGSFSVANAATSGTYTVSVVTDGPDSGAAGAPLQVTNSLATTTTATFLATSTVTQLSAATTTFTQMGILTTVSVQSVTVTVMGESTASVATASTLTSFVTAASTTTQTQTTVTTNNLITGMIAPTFAAGETGESALGLFVALLTMVSMVLRKIFD